MTDFHKRMLTDYHICEYFEDGKITSYNGGDTLDEAINTPWVSETSTDRCIYLLRTEFHHNNRIFHQQRSQNPMLIKIYHVDEYKVTGKEKIYNHRTTEHASLEEAQEECQTHLNNNPKGRKRNYLTYQVRETE